MTAFITIPAPLTIAIDGCYNRKPNMNIDARNNYRKLSNETPKKWCKVHSAFVKDFFPVVHWFYSPYCRMAWSTWCVYMYNCRMWNDLFFLSINLFIARCIGIITTLSKSGPDHPHIVKGVGGHTQPYGPSFGWKMGGTTFTSHGSATELWYAFHVPEIVWKCSDQDLQPFPTKCRTEVHLLFHCVIKIKFIKNNVSLYFFLLN